MNLNILLKIFFEKVNIPICIQCKIFSLFDNFFLIEVNCPAVRSAQRIQQSIKCQIYQWNKKYG